ncbi:unnamed protein product [Clonostachys byssicola]|uniref:phospholipase A2 n=1 Tax=Clonostachys byssicola TaxID=160290 RepID=A0A9N9UWT6_9HYPO|nr:unnamed protein product [Clonostachys byssicola]
MEDSQPIRLLSLDGGGIRGLSSLIILRHLMKQVDSQNPPKPCEYFDLIGGTSTGGLIAIMLGRLRMSVDECIDKYKKLSARVFQIKRHKMNLLGRGRDFMGANGKYDSEGLADAFKSEAKDLEGDGNAAILSSLDGCKIFVCTQAKSLNATIRIRSYKNPTAVDNLSIRECKIWEAARATSAASGFFDPIKIGNETFVDGATGCNNPVEEVWREANSRWSDLRQRIQCVVSIGTGQRKPRPFGDDLRQIGKTLITTATETEETERRFSENHIVNGLQGRYFRFSVDRGLDGVKLDDVDKLDTVQAATEVYLGGDHVQRRLRLFVESKMRRDDWVTEAKKNEYLNWLRRFDSGRLHYAAATGAGKSILCSSVIDEIAEKNYGTCCYFYFSFLSPDAIDAFQIVCSVLTATLRDLIRVHPTEKGGFIVPKAFQELFAKYHPFAQPRISDLESTLIKLLREAKDVFILIDGLDEATQKLQGPVLEFLINITQNGDNPVHTLVSSRPEAHIENMMSSDGSTEVTNLPIDVYRVNSDIGMHLEATMLQPSFRRWSDKLKTDVTIHITTKANGVFRWAALQLEALSNEEREKDIRRVLKRLPKDLEETYGRMLQHIEQQHKTDEALTILGWLAYSARPLTIAEVAELVAFDIYDPDVPPEEDTFRIDFNPEDRFPEARSALKLVSGFVSCEDDYSNPPIPIVKFAHFSVLEYLQGNNLALPRFRLDPFRGNRLILKCCLAYIAHYERARQRAILSTPYPILVYALVHWRRHAELSRGVVRSDWPNMDIPVAAIIMAAIQYRFQVRYNEKEKALEIMAAQEKSPDTSASQPELILVTQQQLLDSGLSEDAGLLLDWMNSVWHFPQHLFLDGLVEPSLALHNAAAMDCVGIVEILLDAGLGITRPYCGGCRPLHVAARRVFSYHRHSSNEVNTTKCNAAVIRALVNAGYSSCTQDFEGRTPLHLAADVDNLEGLRVLLELNRDSLNILDDQGQSALSVAAKAGHISIVRCLIEQDGILVDERDKDGRSPLLLAASNGHGSVIELLLGQDDVDPNSVDVFGATSLIFAVRSGHIKMMAAVKALLYDGRVDINAQDGRGETALSYARMAGHRALTIMPLELKDELVSSGFIPDYPPETAHEWERESPYGCKYARIPGCPFAKSGKDPVTCACHRPHKRELEQLLERLHEVPG